MPRLKVAVTTVGCRANQGDSAALIRALDPSVAEVVRGPSAADLTVVNTCCVTAAAERDSRKAIRRALGASGEGLVVATGCAVTAVPGFARGMGERVEIRGGGDRDPRDLAAWINARAGGGVRPTGAGAGDERPVDPRGRARFPLKVQSGCDRSCAYCIVPRARGPSRSRPLDAVLEEVGRLAEEGYREIVLTGVQLGAWGIDLGGGARLADLAAAAADRFAPGRVRLGSVEPWYVDDALLEVVGGHDRICPHVHVPLQSGDDRILAAMGRSYTASGFAGIAKRARRAIPRLALGTDVLCGFPGEDAPAFERTMDLLREVRPSYLHAFPFSPRPGTPAATMPGRPPERIARERVSAARSFGEEEGLRFRAALAGAVREVVIEERRGRDILGTTEDFVPVRLVSGEPLRTGIVEARLCAGSSRRLDAEPV